MAEKIYGKGVYGKMPHEKAPDFVLGQLSFKVEDFILFLNEHKNEKGYVNLDLLKGKDGKINTVLNEWKPENKQEETPVQSAPVKRKVEDAVVIPDKNTDDGKLPF